MNLFSKEKILLLLVLVSFCRCYYDKAAILYPDSVACVPAANPTFTINVLPLLDSKCNSCHGGSSPSAGIKLDIYAEVKKYVTSGSLMGSINQTSSYSPMPKGSNKMPACEIQVIQNWINAGALNN